MSQYVNELMESITKELLSVSRSYYNGVESGMTDAVYDDRLSLLASLERKYPEYKHANSPTEKVGYGPISNSLEKVNHPKKLLSLDKRYDINEITDYFKGKYPVVGSLKADGLTIGITYRNGSLKGSEALLMDAVTRGDGEVGERVLNQVRATNVPTTIPFRGELVIRCEAVIPVATFNKINSLLADENKFKTCRNMAAGSIRNLDPNIVAKRGIVLKGFELVSVKGECTNEDTYYIYQMTDDLLSYGLKFFDYDFWIKQGEKPTIDRYELVYKGKYDGQGLEKIYQLLNVGKKPEGYKGTSLSVSDVVIIERWVDGKPDRKACFVDSFGFKQLEDFGDPDVTDNISSDCIPQDVLTSDYAQRQWLQSLGFDMVDYKLLNSPEEIIEYRDYVSGLRETGYEYDTDGIVYCVDSIPLKKSMGTTAKHPLSALAFKFPNKGQTSEVLSITWQQGMFSLTPVVTISPVEFDGVTVTRATAHNLNFILGKSAEGNVVRPPILPGCQVRIERGGEVIPKISDVFYTDKSVEDTAIAELYPSVCPVCGHSTFIEGVDLICGNHYCPGKIKACLRAIVARGCLNITGLGEKTIDLLMAHGYIKELFDLFRLRDYRVEMMKLDGLGEKSVDKILDEIEKAKLSPLPNLIASLCIKGVGLEVGRILATKMPNGLPDIFKITKGDLLKLDGIGEVTADNIISYVITNKSAIFIANLIKYGYVGTMSVVTTRHQPIAGMTFCITGTLSKERTFFEEIIRNYGGKVTSNVSSKTTCLVVGVEPGASKMEKAKEHNVNIITEDGLLRMVDRD